MAATRMPRENEQLVYSPELLANVTITYTNARLKVDAQQKLSFCTELDESDQQPVWGHSEEFDTATLQRFDTPAKGARYADCPSAATRAANHASWEKKLRTWIRTERPLRLLKSSLLKTVSNPGETERDFRIRLQQLGNEQRDLRVAKLRKTYETKVARLEDRLMRAEQAVDRESEQATQSKLDTALSVGTAVLGALLGRKRVSATSVSRAGTAARRAGNMRKQSGDVKRARARADSIKADIEDLAIAFDNDVAEMDDVFDAQNDTLSEVLVRARSTNIQIDWFGIAWRAGFMHDSGSA
jgi:hypothetical protein